MTLTLGLIAGALYFAGLVFFLARERRADGSRRTEGETLATAGLIFTATGGIPLLLFAT